MSLDGNGNYTLPAGNPVVTNTVISSTVHNNTMTDIKNTLSNAMYKDGQSTPTANIKMGGFKLTGLAAATTAGDAVRYEDALGAGKSVTAGKVLGRDTSGNGVAQELPIAVDSSGNVGIGTSSPNFQTSGRVVVDTNGSSQSMYSLSNGGTARAYYLATSTVTELGSQASPMAFTVNGAERARIDSSGNLLVAQTSSGSWASGGVVLFNNYGGYQAVGIGHASGVASGSAFQNFGYNAAIIGSITQNGTTGVLYNLTSDYRLKNDPQPLTGAKEFVMALQPKKWQWWDGSGEGVGFIAHEFMEVAKYSGNGEKDAVDADGNPMYQSIQPSSSEVMANLVSLLQEQQAIITQLQADVAALKGQA